MNNRLCSVYVRGKRRYVASYRSSLAGHGRLMFNTARNLIPDRFLFQRARLGRWTQYPKGSGFK